MALLTGALSGAGVALGMGWIDSLSRLLWGDAILEGLDRGLPLGWSLLICGGCGLILALLHRPGPTTLLPELRETLNDLNHPDQAPKRDEGRGLLGAALAQIGGGAVGPEALMSRMAALISQRIWRGRDQKLQAATVAGSLGMFGAPLLGVLLLAKRPTSTANRLSSTAGCREASAAWLVLLHFMASVPPAADRSNGSPTSGPALWGKTSAP